MVWADMHSCLVRDFVRGTEITPTYEKDKSQRHLQLLLELLYGYHDGAMFTIDDLINSVDRYYTGDILYSEQIAKEMKFTTHLGYTLRPEWAKGAIVRKG